MIYDIFYYLYAFERSTKHKQAQITDFEVREFIQATKGEGVYYWLYPIEMVLFSNEEIHSKINNHFQQVNMFINLKLDYFKIEKSELLFQTVFDKSKKTTYVIGRLCTFMVYIFRYSTILKIDKFQ